MIRHHMDSENIFRVDGTQEIHGKLRSDHNPLFGQITGQHTHTNVHSRGQNAAVERAVGIEHPFLHTEGNGKGTLFCTAPHKPGIQFIIDSVLKRVAFFRKNRCVPFTFIGL